MKEVQPTTFYIYDSKHMYIFILHKRSVFVRTKPVLTLLRVNGCFRISLSSYYSSSEVFDFEALILRTS